MAALTREGQRCQTCENCWKVGPHFPHDCDCDWRTNGHAALDRSSVTEWNAGCTCGWQGMAEDVEAHAEVCPLPDAWQVADDAENAPTALVHVERGGTIRARCSCGDLDETGHHDSGGETRVLQRLAAHMQLHTTAAARFISWSEVRERRAALDRSLAARDW